MIGTRNPDEQATDIFLFKLGDFDTPPHSKPDTTPGLSVYGRLKKPPTSPEKKRRRVMTKTRSHSH